MKYEIGYVVSALLVLLIIAYRYFHYRKIRSIKNYYFVFLVILGIGEIIVDILSSYFISYCDIYPIWITFLFNQLFYLFQFFMPYLTFIFTFILANSLTKYKKILIYASIPFLFALIVWILNPFCNTLFTFTNNSYVKENLNITVYISAGYYLLASGLAAVMLKKEMGIHYERVMITISIITLSTTLINIITPYTLLTGVGIMLSITLMYLYMQNSDQVIDELTGCFDRSGLKLYLDGGLIPKEKGYCIVISLVNFKSINTIYGSNTGDEILKSTGLYLRSLVNHYKGSYVYRLNGDIFLIISPNKKDYETILENIKSYKNRPYKINDNIIRLDARLLKFEEIDFKRRKSDLVPIIEYAIDITKKTTSQYEVIIDHNIVAEYEYDSALEQYLHRAIKYKLFTLNYQPIYSIKQQKFTMIEALIRLNHPKYGPIPPDKFIRVAESVKLMPQITNCALELVVDFLRTNDLTKYGITSVKLNLSAMDLMDKQIKERLEVILNEDNPSVKLLSFEVTETLATEMNKEVKDLLSWMKSNNLSLSIDDFGSGYANLDSVMKLDFDIIKMDKSMLEAANNSVKGQIIYQDAIAMFKKIGMNVVAEGAETSQDIYNLSKWGIDYIQGFYFSKPLNNNDLLQLLNSRNKV